MAVSIGITAFNAGELSPRLDGRWDFAKYAHGCRTLLNFLPLTYGGVEKRPGTQYIATAKFADKLCRVVPFQFSTVQAYILEFGAGYFRVYRDGGQVAKGDFSAAWATTTSYSVGDYVTESGTVYICRVGHDSGTFADDLDSGYWQSKSWVTAQDYFAGDWVVESSTWYLCLVGHLSGTFATDLSANKWVAQTVFEQTTDYLESELYELQFRQTADALYVTHKNHRPMVIERRGHDDWDFRDYRPRGGPFMPENTTNISLKPSFPAWITSTEYMVGDCVDISTSGSSVPIAAAAASEGKKLVYRKGFVYDPDADHTEWKRDYFWDPDPTRAFVPATNHGFKIGDVITITDGGSPDYAGTYTVLDGTDKNHILIDFAYQARTFAGTETIVPGVSAIYRAIFSHTSGAAHPTPPGNTIDWEATRDYTGTNMRLTASSAVFRPAHVNSLWQVSHIRTDHVQSDTFSSVTTSDSFRVFGGWTFVTNGTWAGTVEIQASHDGGLNYATVQRFDSNSNYNASVTGTEEARDAFYRVAMTAFTSGSVNWTFSSDDYWRRASLRVTKYLSPTQVIVTAEYPPAKLEATTTWAEAAWSSERGYPAAVEFFEQRLVFGGSPGQPQTLWMSRTNDFDEMTLGDLDDDAVSYTINAEQVNLIRWMASQQQLLIGTSGAEWVLGSSNPDNPVTPTNVTVRRQSTRGSKELGAVLVNDVVLFVHGEEGRKVREFVLVDALDKSGYKTPDLTRLAEHITETGIVNVAYQSHPESVLWCVLQNGTLLSMAYERDEDVVGWSRHTTGAAGVFESVAVIPGTAEQEVWVSVQRTINGSVVRYIERLKPRDWGSRQDDAFFVDSGLTFDGGAAKAITGATSADPVVITSAAHGFLDGQQVLIKDVGGMVELNDRVFTVDNPTTNTFELRDQDDNEIIDSANALVDMGAAAFWKMNENSGTVVADSIGSNDGSINFFLISARSVIGKLNRAIIDISLAEYINFGNDSSILVGTSATSWSAWLYLESAITTPTFRLGSKGTTDGWELRVTSTEIKWTNYKASKEIVASPTVSTDSWHHVVVVRNGASSKIYLDNVDLTLDTNTDGLEDTDSTDDIYLMGSPNVQVRGSRYDAIVQFDAAITAANVGTLWNSGQGQETFGFAPYTSGGTVQRVEDTFTNLAHLEGETCQVLADGGKHPDVTVSSGQVQLDYYANVVHIGLGYNADLQPMKLSLSLDTGPTQGREKRIVKLVMRLYKTLNLQAGTEPGKLDDIIFGILGTPMGDPPALFSGDKEITFRGGFDKDGNIFIRQPDPLPATILSLVPEVNVHGRA